MISTKYLILFVCLLTIFASAPVLAGTISQSQAEAAVEGWLDTDEFPMGASIGWQIEWSDAYYDANGVCAYYVVYLLPEGFVVVSADDLVEPIIGFASGYAYYDPSPDNVFGALVSRDLPERIKTAQAVEEKLSSSLQGQNLTTKDILTCTRSLRAKIKWRQLQSSTVSSSSKTLTVSDIRVPPLLDTTWGQDYVYGNYCYNYYTPNHYYDGCVATAMSQIMRYWQWPFTGIGSQPYTIFVNSNPTTALTRGGDSLGGPYNWGQMPAMPGSSLTNTQRQAIGALCYDAGVASRMNYSPYGSGAYMHDAKNALVSTFKYSNAVMGGNEYSNIGSNLNNMMNPCLDAGTPVMLAIYQYQNGQYGSGHCIVADGYGYNASTLYHHLNLGWDGIADAWYNLPQVDTDYYTFNIVIACIYNIYPSGEGEIISGRITNSSQVPLPGVTITAAGGGKTYTAVSNDNGIYALAKVLPNTTYTITADAPGCVFDANRTVTTGTSRDGSVTTGNKGGIDFVTTSALPAEPLPPASISYPALNTSGKYTVSWSASSGATAYELMRSFDNGATWRSIYIDANTSYSENIGPGNYKYSVRAMNPRGTSNWKTGTVNCLFSNKPPSAPASISYPSSSTTGKFTVSWSASTGAASYLLKRSKDNGATWTVLYSGSALKYSENITNGNYRYTVKAVNANGGSSYKTGTVTCMVRRPPPIPASISYPTSSTNGKFTVSWPASSGATSYILKRSSNGGSTWTKIYSGASRSYSQSLGNGKYRYAVHAVNANGASFSRMGATDCIVLLPPPKPASITYPSTSSTGIYTITWPASTGAKSYVLKRSKDNGLTWSPIYSGAARSYKENISSGKYRYCVKAVNTSGYSHYRVGSLQCSVKRTN